MIHTYCHEINGYLEASRETVTDFKVKGFIINNNNVIQKYVRFKNGKLTPHVKSGE